MAVLLTEFNDAYERDIAAELIGKGLQIDYLVTSARELYQGRAEFSHVQLMDERQFHFLDKVRHLNSPSSRALSAAEIQEFAQLESLFMSITDRICFDPKSVRVRKEVYYELLKYWLGFFEKNQITTILFARVPHLGYGNLIYLLAQKRGIKTVIVRETLLENTVLLTDRFNHYQSMPKRYLAQATLPELRQQLAKTELKNAFQPSSLMILNATDNKTTVVRNSGNIWKSIFNLATMKALVSLIHNPWERIYYSPTFLEEPTTWLGYYGMLWRHYWKNARLLKYYRAQAGTVDLKKKYVYVAMHYQPERTTMPEGGAFENQLLMIDILAKSLPKNWLLYVKEHPYQFMRSDVRKMNFRDEAYYDRIKSYPNVRLVSLETNSQQLIHHAQATVTVTGSTGWESLQAKKPVMVFSASAWYSACNSCYIVTSAAQCQQALQAIQKTSATQVEKDVLRFLLYMRKQFVHTAYDDYLAVRSAEPYQTLVENMASAMIKRV